MNNMTEKELFKRIELRKREIMFKRRNDFDVNKNLYGFWNFLRYIDSKWYSEDKRLDLKLSAIGFALLETNIFKNLALSMKTRMGKSYISNMFTGYTIARHKEDSVIRTSYSKDLVETSSEKVKELLRNQKFINVYGELIIKRGHDTKLDWAIQEAREATFVGAGVDGGVTGHGANNVIIGDDLIKNFQQAYSDAYMKTLTKFMDGVFDTRKEEGCREIQIGTRWIEHDVIGQKLRSNRTYKFDAYIREITNKSIEDFVAFILNEKDKGNIDDTTWLYITIPALNKNNKSTCETKNPTSILIAKKKELEERGSEDIWNATYQQRPELTGLKPYRLMYFKGYEEDDIKDKRFDQIIAVLDASGSGSNSTCLSVFKIYGNIAYLIDLVYSNKGIKKSKLETVEAIIRNKVELLVAEGNGLGEIFTLDIIQLLENKNYDVDYIILYSSKNKEIRLLANADWVKEHIILPKIYIDNVNNLEPISITKDQLRAVKDLNGYIAKVKNQDDDFPDTLVMLRKYLGDPIMFE